MKILKNKKFFAGIILFAFFLFNFLFIFPSASFAETESTKNVLTNKMKIVAEGAGYAAVTSDSLKQVFGAAIKAFLSLLGILFLAYVIYGGYNYLVAHGEEEKIKKSLATIRQAIIGLCIIVGAYAIWYFISSYLIK